MLIAVSNSLASRVILLSSKVEMIVVELFLSPKVTLGCVYVPPSCSDSYMLHLENELVSLGFSNDFILCGDFNCPDIEWQTLYAPTPTSARLCSLSFAHNLTQMVLEPTHKHGNCLVLILTNCPSRFSAVTTDTASFMSASDHFVVCADVSTHCHVRLQSNSGPHFNYAGADMLEVENYLLDTDFSSLYASSNVDSIWYQLRSVMHDACTELVPTFRKNNRCLPRWFPGEVRH